MSGSGWLWTAVLLALAVSSPVSAAVPELAPVPRPGLGNLEEGVQAQLEERRAALDDRLAAEAPTDLGAAFGEMGQLYFLYDLMEPAEVCFLNARELEPEEWRWAYYLGALYRLQGSFAEAERWLEISDAQHPDDVATLIRLGRVRLELDDLDGAEAVFARAVELDPESGAAHHGLGRVASARSDWPAAIAALDRALELQPEATSIHHLLGMAWRQQGDLDRARYHLRRNEHGRVVFPDPLVDDLTSEVVAAQFHLKAGNEAMRHGDAARAAEEYRIAADEDLDYAPARYNLALALARTGREEEAIVELNRALTIDPSYRDAHYNLATLLADRGDDGGAARHFEAAWKIDPQDDVARIEWAEALMRAGRPGEAAEQLEAVLAERPEDPRARMSLAGALEAQGDTEGAEAAFRRVVDGTGPDEDRLEARLRLAGLLADRGRTEEAMEEYRQILLADDDVARAHRGLAGLLARAGEYRKAAYHFSRLVEMDRRDEAAWLDRTMSLLLAGEDAMARAGLEQSLVWMPQSPVLTHILARILATSSVPEVRDGTRAVDLAGRAFQAEPSLDHAETLAMALAEAGRWQEALDLVRQVAGEAERRGDTVRAAAAREMAGGFERGEAVRAPWLP